MTLVMIVIKYRSLDVDHDLRHITLAHPVYTWKKRECKRNNNTIHIYIFAYTANIRLSKCRQEKRIP